MAASAFNLTAQINLRGPSNVRQITSRLRKQLGAVTADVKVNLNRNSIKDITALNSSLKNLNQTLGQTTTRARSASKALNSLGSSVSSMSKSASSVNRALNNVATATKAVSTTTATAQQNITAAKTQMEEFGRQSALAVRRFAAFTAVTTVFYAFTGAVKQAGVALIDFDKQLVRLRQISGEGESNIARLQSTVTGLAKNLGVASGELITVSATLAQAGLSIRDTEKALKALALSALAPSFDNLNKTVEGSIALMRQFGISAGELEASLGAVNAVANRFAVESGDIIAAIQRTGGVFASASKGVSEGTDALNEFIAVFTSVRATTRESAETIATGLRTIFTRIQRGSTIEALKDFGITLTDLDGKFVGAYKAIELLAKGLGTLDPRDLKFSQIVEELGGFRQIGKVIPLIQQFSTAQAALNVAQQGSASLTKDAVTAQLALAVQIAKVREEFLSLIREIGGTDSFKAMAKGVLGLASGLIKVADAMKEIVPLLGILGAAKGFGALRQFGRGFMGGMKGKGAASGGLIGYSKGGQVPVALMPGETVVSPKEVNKVGLSRLRKINNADRKGFSKGGYAKVPGRGRTDSFKTSLPEGSFVVRTDATSALGGPGGVMRAANRQKLAAGDLVRTRDIINRKSIQGTTTLRKNRKEVGATNWSLDDMLFLASYNQTTIGANDKRLKKVPKKLMNTYKNAPNAAARGRAFEPVAAAATGRKLSKKGNAFLDTKNAEMKSDKSHGENKKKSYLTLLVKALNANFSKIKNQFKPTIDRVSPSGAFTNIYDGDFSKPNKRVTAANGGEIPIMAQAGEYVINRKSAKSIGYGNLSKLNKYHNGGVVGRYAAGDVVASRTGAGAIEFDKSVVQLAKEISAGGVDIKTAFDQAKKAMEQAAAKLATADPGRVGQQAASRGVNMSKVPLRQPLNQPAFNKLSPAQNPNANTGTKQIQKQTNDLVKQWTDTGNTGIKNAQEIKKIYDNVYKAEKDRLMRQLQAGKDPDLINQAKQGAATTARMAAADATLFQNNMGPLSSVNTNTGQAALRATDFAVRESESGGTLATSDAQNQRASRQAANRASLPMGQQMQIAGAQKGGLAGGAQMAGGKIVSAFQDGLKNATKPLVNFGMGVKKSLAPVNAYAMSIRKAQGATGKLSAVFSPLRSALGRLTKSVIGAGKSLGRRAKGGMMGGGGGSGMGGMMASMALASIGDKMFSGEALTADEAANNALGKGMTDAGSMGLMVGAMAGPIAGVAVAAVGVVQAFDESAKAAKKFKIDRMRQELESNGEKLSAIFKDIGETGVATADQLAEMSKISQGSVANAMQMADTRTEAINSPGAAMFEGIFGAFTSSRSGDMGTEAGQRGKDLVFQEQGYAGLFSTMMNGAEDLNKRLEQIAPKIAAETSKSFQQAATQINGVFEQRIMAGESIADIIGDADWKENSTAIARSNVAVETQIQTIKNNTKMSQEEKDARIDNIIATEAERAARPVLESMALKKSMKDLDKSIRKISFSFTRTLGNMSDSMGKASQGLRDFKSSTAEATAAISGNAKSSTNTGIDSILTTLNNPTAFTGQERAAAAGTASGMFGSQAGNIQKLLEVGPNIESAVLGTINQVVSSNQGDTNEAVGFKVADAVRNRLDGLGLPASLADKVASQVGKAVSKTRRKGEDSVDFGEITEQVPGLTKQIDMLSKTSKGAQRSLEFLDSAFKQMAEATNEAIKLEMDANSRLRKSQDVVFNGNKRLAESLGKTISFSQQQSKIRSQLANQTGGATTVAGIGGNVSNLQNQKSDLEAGKQSAIAAGDVEAVLQFERQIKNTSVALNENVNALKNLADSGEMASAALSEMEKIQQKNAAGANIIEKLVTSTPGEISKMNSSMARLSNNMAGGMNMGTSADQRKQDLDLFNMLAPMLGDQEGALKANVLESMLGQSGVGMTPMFQQVLDSMRNPQADPQQAQAIATYQKAIDEQAKANQQLAMMNQSMADKIAEKTGRAVADAIKNTKLSFEQSQISDSANNINAVPLSTGGHAVFTPKGSDTVPAMLTPGEFVVNRQSTQKNLPLLKSINSGSYSSGGKVGYYAAGGFIKDTSSDPDAPNPNLKVSDQPLKRFDPNLVKGVLQSGSDAVSIIGIPAVYYPIYGGEKNITSDMMNSLGDKYRNAPPSWFKSQRREQADAAREDDFDTRKDRGLVVDLTAGITGWEPGRQGYIRKHFERNRNLGWAGYNTMLEAVGATDNDQIVPKFEMLKAKSGQPATEIAKNVPLGMDGVEAGNSGYTTKLSLSKHHAGIFDPKSYEINDKSSNPTNSVQGQLETAAAMRAELMNSRAVLDNILNIEVAGEEGMDSTKAAANNMFKKAKKYDYFAPSSPDINVNARDSSVDFAEIYGVRGGGGAAAEMSESHKNGLGVDGYGSLSIGKRNVPILKHGNISGGLQSGGITAGAKSLKGLGESIDKWTAYLTGYDKYNTMPGDVVTKASSNTKLQKIQDGSFNSLFATFPAEQLNEDWKSKAPDGLSVFMNKGASSVANWQKNVVDNLMASERGQDLVTDNKGYLIGAGGSDTADININGNKSKHAWANGIVLAKEIVDGPLQGMARTVEKEAEKAQDANFKIGSRKTHQFTLSNKNLSPEDIKFGFGYNDYDIPKLTSQNAYGVGGMKERLKGIRLGSSADMALVDIFRDSTFGNLDGRSLFASSPQELQERIKKHFNEIAKGFDKTDYSFDNETKFQMHKQVGSIDPDAAAALGISPKDKYGYYTDMSESLVGDALKKTLMGKAVADANVVSKPSDPKITQFQADPNAIIGGVLSKHNQALQQLGIGIPAIPAAQIGNFTNSLKLTTDKLLPMLQRMPGALPLYADMKALGQAFQAVVDGDQATLASNFGLSGTSTEINNAASFAKAVSAHGEFLAGQMQATAGIDFTKNSLSEDTQKKMGAALGSAENFTANIDDAGNVTRTQATSDDAPKTILELAKTAFNPMAKYAPGVRDQLVGPVLSMIADQSRASGNTTALPIMKGLASYLSKQDEYMAMTSDPSKEFLDSLFGQREDRNKEFLMMTNGKMGMLPNRDKLDKIKLAMAQEKKQQNAATGGLIYASEGTYVNYRPQGTDTVPAMLTPGEFVVNRQSTQKHLPVLKAINNGNYSTGGIVSYLNNGGMVLPKYFERGGLNAGGGGTMSMGTIPVETTELKSAIDTSFSAANELLNTTLQSFGLPQEALQALQSFSQSLNNLVQGLSSIDITPQVQFTGAVDVNVKGVEGMTAAAKDIVNSAIHNALNRLKEANSGANMEIPGTSEDFTNGG